MELTTELKSVLNVLDAATVPYAVCGGIAVTLHGYTRFTRDIDLMIRAEDLERALAAVAPLGYTIKGGRIPLGFGEPYPRDLYRVSKAEHGELMTLDFVLVNPLLEPAWASRVEFNWEGRPLSVVSREGLAILKRIAGRPQDLLDLDNLGIPHESNPSNPT